MTYRVPYLETTSIRKEFEIYQKKLARIHIYRQNIAKVANDNDLKCLKDKARYNFFNIENSNSDLKDAYNWILEITLDDCTYFHPPQPSSEARRPEKNKVIVAWIFIIATIIFGHLIAFIK